MQDAKYIVHDYEAVVFAPRFDHAQTADRLQFSREHIQGSGFVSFGLGTVKCYGQSISLDIKSRGEEDSEIVHRLLYGFK